MSPPAGEARWRSSSFSYSAGPPARTAPLMLMSEVVLVAAYFSLPVT